MGARISWLILLQLLLSVLVHGYDNVGFDGWYQPVPHRPVDIITDVINDLGVRILQQYTAHGNVAFSPTGVGFVLAALYEGSAGRGRQQIADALGLPRDRDITRIGFRDIHRRLRTYLNADGFLGGLTLNHENTKLRPEYEDVLRFYGFDLSIPEEDTDETTSAPETTTVGATDQPTTETSASSPDETTEQTATTIPTTTAQIPTIAQVPTTQIPTTRETTTRSEQSTETTSETPTSTTPSVELLGMTLSTMDEQDRLTETTPAGAVSMGGTKATAATTLPSSITTSSAEPIASTTPTSPITTPTVSTTTTAQGSQTTASPVPPTTIAVITTVQSPSTESTPPSTTLTSTTTVSTPPSITASELPPTPATLTEGTTESSTVIAPTESVTEPVPESTTVSTTSSTTTIATTTIATTTVVASSMETSTTSPSPPVNFTEASVSSTIPTQTDQTSIGATDGPPADENTVSTDSPNNRSISNEMGSTDLPVTTVATGEIGSTGQLTTVSSSATMMNRRKRSYRSPRGFFSSYPDEGIWMQDLGIWKPYSTSLNEASVRDSTEISFLVNGCDVSSVTASRYFAVLPFAYFPSLHAVALEFPLDDPRYNIILMMATDRRDTYRLARDLGGKSLRLLRKQLQSTWVRATIPSFMLRGFVTLTSFLQRLGILDVFEPRAADLSPMTPDLGVYARDAQQSIGVNIRNYMKPDRTHSRNGLFERAGPVPFTVVQPFLYFIVDAETSVALIAGRVNDPLNSRIL